MFGRFDENDVASDYQQLLRRGSVARRLALTQHAPWRQAMRRRARADELRVRTWSRPEPPATVWAVLADWSLTGEERESLRLRLGWLRED